MHVAKRTDYAVRAMMYLAERYGEGNIQSADIAARQGIPEAYLDQLLGSLRKAGLVRSVRGPQGGHSLMTSPDHITLLDIVTALEGAPTPLDCLEGLDACVIAASCALREVWRDIDEATQRILQATTVGDLNRRQQARSQASMYHI
jgi:Rrf2 family protein